MGTPRVFGSYVSLLTTVSLATVLWAAHTLTSFPPVSSVTAFLLSYVIVELFQLVFPSGAGLSLGSALIIAATVCLGPKTAILLQAAGALLVGLVNRAPRDRLAVNLSHFVLSVAGAGLVFEMAGGVTGQSLARHALPFGLAILCLWLIQVGLATLALSLYKPRPLAASLKDVWGLPLVLSLTAVACSVPLVAAIAAVGELAPLTAAALIAVIASIALKSTARLSQQRVLSGLLPPAHPAGGEAAGRTDALVRLVSALALASGLGSQERDALQWAALFHDSGLSEAAAAASSSSAPLTLEQVRIVREHPVRAATQVGRLGNLLWVARILETHHERYNGWGYPFGLKGDEIPFPAVLLGIAEAYLALTTPRPYRPRARTPAEALAHLRAQSGEQFHPRAVETLERALESGALVEFDEPAAHRLVEEAVGRLRRATAAPRLPSNISSRWLGSDPWTEAGGLQAILRALFPSWTALHVHRRAADWYRSLYELGQIFSSSLDEESLASQAAQAVYNLTTLPCEVCLVGADGESLETSAIRGLPRNAVSGFDRGIRHGLSGVAFAEGRPVVSVDAGTDPRVRNRVKVRELGVKSCVVVPLAAGGVPLGTITVYSPTVRSFSPVEVQVLAAIANLAALALQNAALYRKAGDRLVRLVRTQRFLQTILDTAPVGIVAFDSAGALSLVNRVGGSYLAALGFETGSGGEVLTLFLGELQDRLGLEAAAGECAEGWERAGPVMVTVDITAGEASFQVWSSPLEGELSGGPGTLLILDDVTEAKRLEDEVRRTERLAAVGEIAAKAAHEIRNPLSSLQGFSQLLALYCPVKEQWPECNAFVERVESEVERLEEIVQSMLVMARPTPKTIERADLTTPALEALAMLSGRASELGVSLQGPQCPAGVLADFDFRQQKQVVLNLVQNALDAVGGPGGPPPGERRVEVSVGYERRGKRRLAVLRVWDNGPGIRPGDENKIFTPFFTTKHTGTGLGLSVSRGIIEAHGGELRWQPVKGQGAVFEVLLPAPDPGRSD